MAHRSEVGHLAPFYAREVKKIPFFQNYIPLPANGNPARKGAGENRHWLSKKLEDSATNLVSNVPATSMINFLLKLSMCLRSVADIACCLSHLPLSPPPWSQKLSSGIPGIFQLPLWLEWPSDQVLAYEMQAGKLCWTLWRAHLNRKSTFLSFLSSSFLDMCGCMDII